MAGRQWAEPERAAVGSRVRVQCGHGCGQQRSDGFFGSFFVDTRFFERALVEHDVGQVRSGQKIILGDAVGEALVQLLVQGLVDLVHIDGAGVDTELGCFTRDGRDAVIGGEREPDVLRVRCSGRARS